MYSSFHDRSLAGNLIMYRGGQIDVPTLCELALAARRSQVAG